MIRVRRNWTAEEDALLRKLVTSEIENSRPLLWRELAKQIPGRSNKDCRKRWWNSLANSTTKGPWSEAEDKRLIKAVWEHGTNWNEVARIVGTRYADQCSSHWSQVLDPDINHCDWTAQEDEQLLHAVLSHGTTWSTIAATHRPKRTTLALKNRYSTLRSRHQNSGNRKEAVLAKAPSSPAHNVMTRAKSRNRQNDRFNVNDDTEDEEEDDEVDEDGENREEEEEQEANEHGASSFPLIPNCTPLDSIPNTTETPAMWTGMDQWMNIAMNMNIDPQLYPSEGVFCANQDNMNIDPMNIDFDNFQPSNNGNPIMPVNRNTPPGAYDVARLTPESSLEDPNLLPAAKDVGAASATYHISITMACKPDQLGDVMTWVTTTGLACDVKIKSQA